MREWIKALPLGLGLPVVIGAASVKPEDAASNVAAWLHLIGIERVPEWLTTPNVDNRIILGSLALGFIYAFLVWGVPALRRIGVPKHNDGNVLSPEPPIRTPDPIMPKRLKDLFDADFPNLGKKMRPITLTYDGLDHPIACMMYVHQDFDSGSEFISFYIPACGKPLEVCDYFVHNYRPQYDQLKQQIHFNIRAAGEAIVDRSIDLNFSGRVYLYHEDDLTYAAFAQITEMFNQRHITVRFRGQNYVTDEWRKRLAMAQS
jgi:hypothetical protein